MSSTAPVIHVSGLSKVYHLYSRQADRLWEALHPLRKKYHQEFFALQNLSFQVGKGEALGILGRNGSGKSTLLKIITGVLTPTAGEAHVRGKVSALLELGTGFNPELTGLENIYFSGTIQGRERRVTERLVPDILAFADIGPYIHQPVKTYSSGMFARLAFAVAVVVDPDILIVDEALSVGDMRFQQKCIRKMQSFRDQGKTILFVSHDTGSITTFCDRALWLDQGRMRELDEAKSVAKRYAAFMAYGETGEEAVAAKASPPDQDSSMPDVHIPWVDLSCCENFGDGGARITKAALLDASTGLPVGIVRPGAQLRLLMHIRTTRTILEPGCGILLKNRLGQPIFSLNNYFLDQPGTGSLPMGLVIVTFLFYFPHLTHGRYAFSLAMAEGTLLTHTQLHWVHDAFCLDVAGGGPAYGSDCVLALPQESWTMHWEVQPV